MKVFISYADTDREVAQRVTQSLKADGLSVWSDEDEVFPGDNWAAKVAQGVEEADAIVALLTPESLHSRSVRSDINYALGKKALKDKLIPVWLGGEDSAQQESFPWILRHLPMIQLLDNEQDEVGFKRIADALHAAPAH